MFFARNKTNCDTKYVARLSLEELKCFMEQVQSLPCIIQEAELIQVTTSCVCLSLQDLLNRVESFMAVLCVCLCVCVCVSVCVSDMSVYLYRTCRTK